jgi:hypothetical protein
MLLGLDQEALVTLSWEEVKMVFMHNEVELVEIL